MFVDPTAMITTVAWCVCVYTHPIRNTPCVCVLFPNSRILCIAVRQPQNYMITVIITIIGKSF